MRPTKEDIDNCRRCSLWERATQGVPGEGPRDARLMLVGEQPGDAEDRAGEPFVGAAGKLLRRALQEIGIAPTDVYITNAVKHFSWEPRGIRRIHKTPAQREIATCHDWLEAEIASIRPPCIVALGATALFALLGKRIAVTAATGRRRASFKRRDRDRDLPSVGAAACAGSVATRRALPIARIRSAACGRRGARRSAGASPALVSGCCVCVSSPRWPARLSKYAR